ncbi:unnamed protein product, partial [Prorocentrum cordatum]
MAAAGAAPGRRAAAAAAEPAAASGRRGPCGQPLRGPEQHAAPLEAPPVECSNPLVTPSIRSRQRARGVRRHRGALGPHAVQGLAARGGLRPRARARVARGGPGVRQRQERAGGQGGRRVRRRVHISAPLVRIARDSTGAASLVADCLCTPFRSGSFDVVLSIAVLHHLSTEPRRVQALREAARLLRPGGELLVYCWSYEQDSERSRSRHRFPTQDVLVPWNRRAPGARKPKPARGAGAEAPEAAAPAAAWEAAAEVHQRYCHGEGELPDLLAHVPELELVESYFSARRPLVDAPDAAGAPSPARAAGCPAALSARFYAALCAARLAKPGAPRAQAPRQARPCRRGLARPPWRYSQRHSQRDKRVFERDDEIEGRGGLRGAPAYVAPDPSLSLSGFSEESEFRRVLRGAPAHVAPDPPLSLSGFS